MPLQTGRLPATRLQFASSLGRLGKNKFVAYQASARGGVVRVRVSGDRVHLAGQAVTVMRGELLQGGTA